MSEQPASEQPYEDLRRDVDAVEKKMAGEIDPGARAVVVAVLVFAVLGAIALPHTGHAHGFDVLAGNDIALSESIQLPSRLFAWFSLVFAVGFSMLALLTRRWVFAWIALAGSAVASVLGMLAIWTRQTLAPNLPGAGPGIGLVIGWIAVMVLTFHWLRVVWSRTAVQLAAEEQRRLAAAEEERRQQEWRQKG
ncbi:hypothetical protein [Aldersonia kunmingensis]|uniref:Rv2732c family membrane protein n=1 Tax=Aldersonia kunmingensis TaxID=408066 RepID=UPI00082A9D9E|nr:hypothetical protein [Aldersonia kunmingensis]